MVVDIRYHLASLVAVFFALGLGILVGMSISDGEKGSELREQWMTAIESELEAVRIERKEAANRLEVALGERDRYKEFADELVSALVEGRLAGGRTAVVHLGDRSSAVQRTVGLIERAGAIVPGRSLYGAGDLDQLSTALLGSSKPGHVVVILSGAATEYRAALEELVRRAEASGAGVTAVVDEQQGWRDVLDDLGVGYVTHVDSPAGGLSLVLLLAAGEPGRYGADADLPFWPKHLLRLAGAGVERP